MAIDSEPNPGSHGELHAAALTPDELLALLRCAEERPLDEREQSRLRDAIESCRRSRAVVRLVTAKICRVAAPSALRQRIVASVRR